MSLAPQMRCRAFFMSWGDDTDDRNEKENTDCPSTEPV